MLTVAHRGGVLDALAIPYDGPVVTGCASDSAMSGTSAAGSWAIAIAGTISMQAHASMARAAVGRNIPRSIGSATGRLNMSP